jgi:hypothetical protein
METIYWSDALVTMPRHIRLRGVSPKMLSPEGEVVEIYDNGKVYRVLFDKKFAFWVLTERFLKPLGLIGREDYLRGVFFPELIEFLSSEGIVSRNRELYNLARMMTKINGKSFEENVEVLRSTLGNENESYYENGNVEEYTTATVATSSTGKKK